MVKAGSLELKDLKFSAIIEIDGEKFELTPSEDYGGELAIWRSNNYEVCATPGLNGVCLPVSIYTRDGKKVGSEEYWEPVSDFDKYCRLVKAIAGKLITLFDIENEMYNIKGAEPLYTMQYAINFSGLCVIPAESEQAALEAFKAAINNTGLDINIEDKDIEIEEAYE